MRCLLALLIVCVVGLPSATAQDVKVGSKTIKQWSIALQHAEARIRFQTVAALYEEGADAAPLVKQLMPLLKDPQPAIRRGVAQTLGNCKGEAAPAVPALVAALKDADYGVRNFASQALGEIGEAAAAPLVELLNDKDATIRFHAIVTMNGLGLQGKEVAKALGKAIKDTNPTVRQAALFALSKLETDDAEIFALLGEGLRDKEKGVRLTAASILVGKGNGATETLIKAAEEAKVEQRLTAIQAIASLGEEVDEKGVMALRKALGDDDLKVKQAAALGLASLGLKARKLGGDQEIFLAIAKLLSEKDALLRRAAVHALGQIGSEDAGEIKQVAGLLKDADAMVRSFTVQALAGYLGEEVSDELRTQLHDHLILALRDTDRRVPFMAAQSLSQQGFRAVEPLTKVVEEAKGPSRLWAATILGEIGSFALDAVPALQKMSRDMNSDVRRIALMALKKIEAEQK